MKSEPTHVSNHQQGDQDLAWRPGVVRRAPWLAISAIVAVILCIAASAAILLVSKKQPSANWRIQPTVWLSVLSTIANMLLTSALGAGVNIVWWKSALQGATLNDLHRHWLYGNSIWAALISWKHVNRVAVATLLVIAATLNGPLLQRASSVTSLVQESPKDLSVQIATMLPNGFTGLHSQFGGGIALLKHPFTQVVLDYSNRIPLYANISQCDGSCDLTVQGVGLSTECVNERLQIDHASTVFGPNGTILPTAFEKHTVFNTTFGFLGGDTSLISMNSTYTNTTSNGVTSCPGLLITNRCTLRPAIVEYQLHIENNGSRIQLIPSAYPRTVSVVTYIDRLLQDSTIGGIYLAAQQLFTSQASISIQQNHEWNIESSGSLVSRYLHLDRDSSHLIY